MDKQIQTILSHMGGTPIVKIRKDNERDASIFVKMESFNPGESIKSRVALEMILAAEKDGRLKPNSGQTIVEPTGGNTGIGLAIAGALRGYKVRLVVPDTYSREKTRMLQAYGAEVILSRSSEGRNYYDDAEELVARNPEHIWLNQFRNEANPRAHYTRTAPEILRVLPTIDCFVAAIGSGGTITGAGRRIKEACPNAVVVGVQPKGCDVLKGVFVPHRIQAISVGFTPPILDVSVVDRMISVEYAQVVTCLRKLASEEGLLCGLSSGANIVASRQMASELGSPARIVTVSPDSGRSYMDVYDHMD